METALNFILGLTVGFVAGFVLVAVNIESILAKYARENSVKEYNGKKYMVIEISNEKNP